MSARTGEGAAGRYLVRNVSEELNVALAPGDWRDRQISYRQSRITRAIDELV